MRRERWNWTGQEREGIRKTYREKGGEREGVTRESWRESDGGRRVGENIEKDTYREGEKGKRGSECVCMFRG